MVNLKFYNVGKGYNIMEKEIYYTPYLFVLVAKTEEVICTSADTDFPFEDGGYGDDIFDD